jgi:hypothetical protein
MIVFVEVGLSRASNSQFECLSRLAHDALRQQAIILHPRVLPTVLLLFISLEGTSVFPVNKHSGDGGLLWRGQAQQGGLENVELLRRGLVSDDGDDNMIGI